MTGTSFNLSAVFQTVAEAVPDQEVLVWGEKGEAQVLKAIDEVLKALA